MEKRDLLLEQWKMASELHRHMDDMVWRRFDYFVGLNTVLLGVYGYVWSQGRCAVVKFFGSIFVPLLGVVLSLSWAAIHKRAQLYHSLRKQQAETAERALAEEMDLEQPMVCQGSGLVYGVKPEDCGAELMEKIPHSAWGRIHTLDVVFGIALGTAIMWAISIVASAVILYFQCCLRLVIEGGTG